MSSNDKRFFIECDNKEDDWSTYLECEYESWLHPDYTEKEDYIEFVFNTGGGYGMDAVVTLGKEEYRLENFHKISLKFNGGYEREALLKFLSKVLETEKIIGILK